MDVVASNHRPEAVVTYTLYIYIYIYSVIAETLPKQEKGAAEPSSKSRKMKEGGGGSRGLLGILIKKRNTGSQGGCDIGPCCGCGLAGDRAMPIHSP
jgi:hypothetical protein